MPGRSYEHGGPSAQIACEVILIVTASFFNVSVLLTVHTYHRIIT